MNSPQGIDLIEASKAFSVANTPLFLVRKLRSDPAVQELGREFSSEQLLWALTESVADEPRDLDGAVRPYAYLVALALQSTMDGLARAGGIRAPYWDWFDYIRNYLVKTYLYYESSRVMIPNQVYTPAVSMKSGAPTERQQIIIPGH